MEKCKHCKKLRGLHKAKTLACPIGTKTRIGYTSFSSTSSFESILNKKQNSHDFKI